MSPSRIFILRPVATTAADGRAASGGSGCLHAAPGFGSAGSRLPHDSSGDVLSGRRSGCDGVLGDGSAGAPVRTGSRAEPDDLDQFLRQFRHHAAVQSRREHRRRRTAGAGGDQCRHDVLAARSAEPADLQQGQSGGLADPDAGSDFGHACRFRRWRILPTPRWRRKFRSCRVWAWFPSAADRSRQCGFGPIRPRWPPME